MGYGDLAKQIYLGKSDTIVANITAGNDIPGLSIDGASVKRVFDSLQVNGQRYAVQIRVKFPGTVPTTPSVVARLRGAPALTKEEAVTTDLWFTIKDTTALTAAGVRQDADAGPFPRWVQVVSGAITAVAWNGGATIEVWLVGC